MAQAIRLRQTGGPEVLKLEDIQTAGARTRTGTSP